MSKYAYGNTETVDLWNSWSEVSQKDVAQLMDTWTTVTGYPYLTVVSETWTDSELVVTLRQARFLSDGSSVDESSSSSSAPALWSIPLLFVTADSTSSEAVTMDQKEQTFSIPISSSSSSSSAAGWVKINAGQKALVRVSHSPEMIARLKDSITSVAPVDRAALLLDAYALAKAGLAPLETAVDILCALKGETTSIVWSAIAGVLSGLNLLMEQLSPTGNSDGYKAFVLFGKELVTSALTLVRNNCDDDDDDNNNDCDYDCYDDDNYDDDDG
jgi:aminopeptidase N